MEQETKVKRGEIIFFSSGEYSDYSYNGQVVFTKDCDLIEMRNEFKSHVKTTGEWPYSDGFVTFLVAREVCLPLDCREIHLGSYGELLGEQSSDWT